MILLMLCSVMATKLLVAFPFKNPPIMMATAVCAFSACVMLTKDTYDRFTHEDKCLK